MRRGAQRTVHGTKRTFFCSDQQRVETMADSRILRGTAGSGEYSVSGSPDCRHGLLCCQSGTMNVSEPRRVGAGALAYSRTRSLAVLRLRYTFAISQSSTAIGLQY